MVSSAYSLILAAFILFGVAGLNDEGFSWENLAGVQF